MEWLETARLQHIPNLFKHRCSIISLTSDELLAHLHSLSVAIVSTPDPAVCSAATPMIDEEPHPDDSNCLYLVDICVKSIVSNRFWRVQRRQVESLPDFLANRILDALVRQHTISPATLPLFAACATTLTLPSGTPVGDGGAWFAAVKQFSGLRGLALTDSKRLRGDRLALLAPLGSTLQRLSLSGCENLAFGDHLSAMTALTSLDVSGTAVGLPPAPCLAGLQQLRIARAGLRVRDCAELAALTRLTLLDLSDNYGLADRGCSRLSALTRLQHLDLSQTDASAPPVLPSLTALHMANCKIGGNAADAYGHEFSRLVSLHLPGSYLDADGVRLLSAAVAASEATLLHLDLRSTDLARLDFLVGCGALRTLDLSGTYMSASQLENLQWLAAVEVLNLANTRADTSTALALKGLPRLRSLSLSWTGIQNASLPYLQSVQGPLAELNLSAVRITGDPAADQHWGTLQCLTSLNLLDTDMTSEGCQSLEPLGATLRALYLGSKQLEHCNSLRHLRLLEKLWLEGCRLTWVELHGAVCALLQLRELVVQQCRFVLAEHMKHLLRSVPLKKLRLVIHDSVHLLDLAAVEAAAEDARLRANRSQNSEFLAAFDERIRYSRADLLHLTGAEDGVHGVPQLDADVQSTLCELAISVGDRQPLGSATTL